MLRTAALALVFSMLPASALACGMYIPPENDKLLAEILEEIDQTANKEALAAVKAEPAKPVVAEVVPAEKTEAPSVIPEVAVVQPAS